jgi:hypothetical protein
MLVANFYNVQIYKIEYKINRLVCCYKIALDVASSE